jgi:tRNA threonylcarbamoyladenosine biosynthesis protein TsaB
MFGYSSLMVLAHAHGRADVGAIADARRDLWHHYRIGGSWRRVPTGELSGELMMPEHFRHWSPLPPNVTHVPYSVAELLPKVWDVDLLRETDTPDAFLHEEPQYVTWTPQVHRAPTK